jgi:hypothetical protein
MSTFYVKKSGTRTHDSIQSAIYDAQNGDIINIGEGTWNENIEMYKAVQLVGAGKDSTFVQGQFAPLVLTGGSFYQGEDIITVPSTADLVRGRRVLATNFTANSRVSEIISSTQFRVSPATVATAIAPKTAVSVVSGSSTITLPNTTSLVVGMKVTGTGVSGLITAINATTKVITLSTPNTASGSNIALTFRLARTAVQVTMPTQFTGSTIPASLQVMNVAMDGWKIKDMTITGFDNPLPNVEVAAVGICSANHSNWSIENCKIIADGDSALITALGFVSTNGVIQNCIFDGKTFVGANPATGNQYSVWNVPRQLVVIQAASGVNFVNNQVLGTTGGLTVDGIQSFNTAVTIDSNGSVVTGNTINTISGYGFGIRVRGFYPTVENNFNVGTSAGYYVLPNHSNGVQVSAGTMLYSSSKYWVCIQAHTSSATTQPSGASGATYWSEITLQQVNDSGSYGIGLATIGSNSNVLEVLVTSSQTAGDSFVSFEMGKSKLKEISLVSSHPIFSNEANWYMVSYVFKHDSSSRRLVPSFSSDFTSVKNADLRANMKTGDKFELKKIIISKADRTFLVIKRSQISGASSFDFNLLNDGPIVTPQTPALWSHQFSSGLITGQTMQYSSVSYLDSNSGSYVMIREQGGNLNSYSYAPRIEWSSDQVSGIVTAGNYKVRVYVSDIPVGSLSSFSFLFGEGGYRIYSSKAGSSFNGEYFEFDAAIAPSMTLFFMIDPASTSQDAITLKISKIEVRQV